MTGVILAVVQNEATADSVLDAASRSALLMRATRISVLAIRTPNVAMVPVSEGMLTFDDADPSCEAEQARLARLQRGFTAWAGQRLPAGLDAEWVEADGWAEQLIDDWAERAGLIVIGRPGPAPPEPERRALQAALFDSGRPVLVVPPAASPFGQPVSPAAFGQPVSPAAFGQPVSPAAFGQPVSPAAFGRRIAIAWRDDARTAEAVRAALAWLGGAEIHVLAGARAWASPPTLPPLFAEHGLNATLHVLPLATGRGFGESLLARAHALGADMLVLGAFAHPMLRGLILGGVTRHMLAQADLPVLMRH